VNALVSRLYVPQSARRFFSLSTLGEEVDLGLNLFDTFDTRRDVRDRRARK
jgi:hypothetical protein